MSQTINSKPLADLLHEIADGLNQDTPPARNYALLLVTTTDEPVLSTASYLSHTAPSSELALRELGLNLASMFAGLPEKEKEVVQ